MLNTPIYKQLIDDKNSLYCIEKILEERKVKKIGLIGEQSLNNTYLSDFLKSGKYNIVTIDTTNNSGSNGENYDFIIAVGDKDNISKANAIREKSSAQARVLAIPTCLAFGEERFADYVLFDDTFYKDIRNKTSVECYIISICRCVAVILNQNADTPRLDNACTALKSLLNNAMRFLRADNSVFSDVFSAVALSSVCEEGLQEGVTDLFANALCNETDINLDYIRLSLLPAFCRVLADTVNNKYKESAVEISKEKIKFFKKRLSILADCLCKGEADIVISKQLSFIIPLFKIKPLEYIGDDKIISIVDKLLDKQQNSYFNFTQKQIEDILYRSFNKIRLSFVINYYNHTKNGEKRLAELAQKYDLSQENAIIDDPFYYKNLERQEFVSGLQKYTLETLVLTKKFLDEHGLTFYLGEGTLLGAIRHNGFIPWDDDVDILMPREDYNKLVKLVKQGKLPPELNFDSLENNPKHWVLGAKMQLTRPTEYIQHKVTPLSKFNGPYVDIFPLDYWDKPFSVKYHFYDACIKYARDVIFMKTRYTQKQLRGKAKRSFFIRLYRPFIKNTWIQKLALKCMKASYNGNRKYMVNLCSYYPYYKEVFPSHFFSTPKYVSFEGEQMPVPRDYDAMLKVIYGSSYDTIPPVKVTAHHNHAFTLKTPEEIRKNNVE